MLENQCLCFVGQVLDYLESMKIEELSELLQLVEVVETKLEGQTRKEV